MLSKYLLSYNVIVYIYNIHSKIVHRMISKSDSISKENCLFCVINTFFGTQKYRHEKENI